MPLEPIGLSMCELMLKHLADLIALPNRWTVKEADYLQRMQRALVHFKQLWRTIEKEDIFWLAHELRTPLSPIIGYRELFEATISQPILQDTLNHLSYLEFASKVLLCKVNELVDRSKNPNLAEQHDCSSKWLDTESLDLIDRLLDAALELRLIPENHTELQRDIVEELHAALLRLNHYWQVLDAEDNANLRLVESVTGLVVWLVKLLAYDYKDEKGLKYLQSLEKLSPIVEAKVRYFAEKAYTINSLD
jgi:signal transduction histidine kinase